MPPTPNYVAQAVATPTWNLAGANFPMLGDIIDSVRCADSFAHDADINGSKSHDKKMITAPSMRGKMLRNRALQTEEINRSN